MCATAVAGVVRVAVPDFEEGLPRRFPLGRPSDFKMNTLTWLQDRDLLVIRNEDGMGAFSCRCTHLGCMVRRTADGFECPCHGAEYGPLGEVVSGPARRPLPWYRALARARRPFVGGRGRDARRCGADTRRAAARGRSVKGFLSTLRANAAALPANLKRGMRTGARQEEDTLTHRMRRNFLFHLHPVRVATRTLEPKATLGLGVMTLTLFAALALSGVLLMIYYVPSPGEAYTSTQDLEYAVTFGAFLRALHRWAGHAMVLTAVLHLLRVSLTGAYFRRELNWTIGLGLFLLTLGLAFTGYLLPWDQLAFWAVSVSANMLDYIPWVGGFLKRILLGGREVGQAALIRFYMLHVALLPGLLLGLVVLHVWRVAEGRGPCARARGAGERFDRSRLASSAASGGDSRRRPADPALPDGHLHFGAPRGSARHPQPVQPGKDALVLPVDSGDGKLLGTGGRIHLSRASRCRPVPSPLSGTGTRRGGTMVRLARESGRRRRVIGAGPRILRPLRMGVHASRGRFVARLETAFAS